MHEHGERARTPQLQAALSSADPMPQLYHLIGDFDPNRPTRFKTRLDQLLASRVFGERQFNIAANDFQIRPA
jgi:hypothetical protein